MAGLTGPHLLIALAIIVLLFGAAKLPLLAKNLGQSAKILKRELRDPAADAPAGAADRVAEATAAPAPVEVAPRVPASVS